VKFISKHLCQLFVNLLSANRIWLRIYYTVNVITDFYAGKSVCDTCILIEQFLHLCLLFCKYSSGTADFMLGVNDGDEILAARTVADRN
jgi:hypothetical protein